MSGSSPESQIQVVIDSIGVMPDPAEMNRYLRGLASGSTNTPDGPKARTRVPGVRWSIIQRVPRLTSCALTVMVIDRGREGLDEMVKVRCTVPVGSGSSSVRNWPGAWSNHAPEGARKQKLATPGASGITIVHSSGSSSRQGAAGRKAEWKSPPLIPRP